MKKSLLTLLATVVTTLGLHAQWVQKPSGEKIALALSDGKTVTLEPSVVRPVESSSSFFGGTVYWTFRLSGKHADTTVAAPLRADLLKVSPKARQLQIQLVHLEEKDGARLWWMVYSKDGFWARGNSAIKGSERVEPQRDGDHYVLVLPAHLQPGHYAIVSDGDIWDFDVQ